MFSDKSDEYVAIAVQAEYEAACHQHGQSFGSEEEAMEALTEEVREALQEASRMYMAVRDGHPDIEALETATENVIKESAQVLAVIRKYRAQGQNLTFDDVERLR